MCDFCWNFGIEFEVYIGQCCECYKDNKKVLVQKRGYIRTFSYHPLLEIRSFTTTILGFSRPEIGGRGIPRRKKVCFSRPHICGRDR